LRNIRSSCGNNMLAADGLLNSPCLTPGDCNCNFPIQTSFAMMYMPEVEAWSGTTPLTMPPPPRKVPSSKELPVKPAEKPAMMRLPINATYSPIDLAPYANRGFIDEKADDGKGGWSDQGPDCDLRDFPTGRQRFNGVPFLVGQEPHSCIVLRSKKRPFPEMLPESATIPVGRPVQGLCFLHAGTYTGENLPVGVYQVQYDDGSTLDIPLVGEINIRDWTCLPAPFLYETCTQSKNAWMGATKTFPDVTVSQMLWVNPKPNIPVKAMKFDNKERSGCPILIGLTAVIKGAKTEDGIRAQQTAAAELLAKGKAALDAGKDAAACELLQKATLENPSLEDAYKLLGEACGRLKDESATLKAYQAWADAGATITLPFNKIGEILERKGDRQGALSAYRQSLCLDGNQTQIIKAKFRLEELLKKERNR